MYTFRRTQTLDSSLEEYLALLRTAFPKTQLYTFEYLHWLYRENPLGLVVGYDALFNDQVIAHYVTVPVQAHFFGKVEMGLLSLNTATHPEHVRKGLFTKLAKLTYQTAFEEGYQFAMGFSNRNSTHGMTKSLGFQFVAPLEARLGRGTHRKNQVPSLMATSDFNVNWNQKLLQWRLKKPFTQYTKKDSMIYRTDAYPGIDVLLTETTLAESIDLKERNPLKLELLVYLNSYNTSSGLYFSIPEMLRPSPLNMIFLDLTGKNRKLKPEKTLIQAIDFDAF